MMIMTTVMGLWMVLIMIGMMDWTTSNTMFLFGIGGVSFAKGGFCLSGSKSVEDGLTSTVETHGVGEELWWIRLDGYMYICGLRRE